MSKQPLLDAALEYASLGWPIFPVRHDKTPYTPNGVIDATTDAAKIEAWWGKWPGANIGLNAGEANLLVLDYDPGHDRDAAERAVGNLPETRLVARTPRGGTHEYFALNPGDDPVPSRAGPFAEHVDVRSFHGYVLLPPSSTKDGVYTWESRKRPAHRTEDLIKACGRVREKSEDWDQWAIDPDLPENILMARRWLRGEIPIGAAWCKPAIEGAGGDQATFAAAAMMKSCGLSPGTALEVLWEEFNVPPREKGGYCDPPWEYEDLETKVGNGYDYNTSPPGNVTPAFHVAKVAGLFKPVEREEMGDDGGRQATRGRYRAVNGPGLKAVQPPSWLIPGTLPEDAYAMLVGPTQAFKTFIALDMALTLATGGEALAPGDWDGLWPAPRRSGTVVFAVGEGRSGLRKRAEAWMQHHFGHERVPPEFILADPVPHVQEESLEAFVDVVQAVAPGKVALVVLDTVSRSMQGMNTNADENATSFTKMTDSLRREFECSVLALHHTGHENQERGRGSYAFLGDPDTILVASRQPKDLVKLSMTKQKDWEQWEEPVWAQMQDVALSGDRSSLTAIKVEAPELPKGEKKAPGHATLKLLDDYVVAVLKDAGRPMSDTALSDAVACYSMGDGEGEVGLGVSARSLRTSGRHVSLEALRAPGSGARSRGMYDWVKRQWRYSSVEPVEFKPQAE